MDWKGPHRELPESPLRDQQARKEFRDMRQLVLDISQGLGLRGTRASVTVDANSGIKEITVEGFIV